jgi:hypothetical protein
MSEDDYIAKVEQYGDGEFVAQMGAEGVRELLRSIDLEREIEQLRKDFTETSSDAKIKKISKAAQSPRGFPKVRREA